jgi:hypothetical protein
VRWMDGGCGWIERTKVPFPEMVSERIDDRCELLYLVIQDGLHVRWRVVLAVVDDGSQLHTPNTLL